ncbi:translation release factor [Aureococcus anophagefferens]|uniref:Translation release factor n=1 Tax=Aureococcus anophagefferens TaxID=44056 RepID=A0ABR1FRY8_AURAN
MRGMRALRRLANPIVGRRARRRVSAAALRALAAKRGRYDELCAVASAEVLAPAAARELSELGEILACQEAWEGCVAELDSLAELEDELRGGDAVGDAELRDEARRERELLTPKVATLAHDLTAKLLPRDAVDDAPACLVEVKAAAGGDEASLFAGDLLAMYERFAGRRRHGWDLLSVTKSDCGGVSHAYAEVKGPGAYGALRFESGVHRVQRVPRNDVRIHTSTASVVVFPAGAEDRGATVDFDPAELRIDTFRASGAGGQHATTRDERSQHRNKAKALKVLASRVVGAQAAAAAAARSASRAKLAGSGDRAERIRTYNAPHDRVTDHRSGFTANSVDRVLRGDLLDDVVASLEAADRDARMVEFEESSA